MTELVGFGRFLILVGLLVVAVGAVFIWLGKSPFPVWSWIGKLPGDILIDRKNFRFYFPITTSILLSLILTGILWLVTRR